MQTTNTFIIKPLNFKNNASEQFSISKLDDDTA